MIIRALLLYILSVLDALLELYNLDSVFHKSAWRHAHHIRKHLIYKVFLHLGHIYNTATGQLLELGVVYVGSVKSNDVSVVIIRRFQHETVIGCGRRELDVRRHTLICMDVGVHFYAAFLLSCFGMPANAF